jgi:hypothetical protein
MYRILHLFRNQRSIDHHRIINEMRAYTEIIRHKYPSSNPQVVIQQNRDNYQTPTCYAIFSDCENVQEYYHNIQPILSHSQLVTQTQIFRDYHHSQDLPLL